MPEPRRATLFQYLNGDGEPHPVRSSDVNDYLRQAAGADATAKDFRTWNASLFAAVALAAQPAPETERAGAVSSPPW